MNLGFWFNHFLFSTVMQHWSIVKLLNFPAEIRRNPFFTGDNESFFYLKYHCFKTEIYSSTTFYLAGIFDKLCQTWLINCLRGGGIISYWQQNCCIYQAPGHHIPFLSHLFPDVNMVLVRAKRNNQNNFILIIIFFSKIDPNQFKIPASDRIQIRSFFLRFYYFSNVWFLFRQIFFTNEVALEYEGKNVWFYLNLSKFNLIIFESIAIDWIWVYLI